MLNSALLAVNIPFLVFAAAASSAPSGPMLTRIDATKAVGMTIVASGKGLTLETLDGNVAKTFPCDGTHLKITSTKSRTWSLKDKRGAGLLITDTSTRYLTVINRGADMVNISKLGGGFASVAVPSHAFTIVNLKGAPPSGILTISNPTVVRRQDLSIETQPVTMICPYVQPNGKTINSIFGVFEAHADFGLTAKPAR